MSTLQSASSARNEVRQVAPKLIEGHLERALANGVTKDEIGEAITHLAFYAGWPASMTAGRIAKQVFEAAK